MESNTATSTPEPEIDNGAGSPEEFVEVRAANEKKSEATILEETNPEETSAVSIENEQNVIGEAAGKQEDEPVVDESARGTAAVSYEEMMISYEEMMKQLVKVLKEINILLRDQNQSLGHENQCLSNENQRLQKLQLDDTWLDGWNTQIFRCTDCNRPFGTQTRLLDHRKTWHSAGSSKIENYAQAGINSNPVGIDELKEIFQSGDLILETTKGDGSVGYVVSSQVLCMTSKVFLKMMGRDSLFKEAIDVRRANVLGFHPAVVTVEDDHQALEFILNVLHHRHDMLPKVLSFPELVRIAEICDKYELQLALKPTLDRFLEPYKTNLTGCHYRDWLLVSYVFGYEDIFSQISKELVLTGFWVNKLRFFSAGLFSPSYSLSSCTPSSITGKHYLPTIVPERGLMKPDKLETQRQETVDKIRNHIESVQADLSSSWKCRASFNQKACEALALGHLIKSVAQSRLNEDETWNQSLRSISIQLKGIADLCFPAMVYNGRTADAHIYCSWVPELRRVVNEAVNSVEGLKISDFPSCRRAARFAIIGSAVLTER
jgi:hypothetical protein